MTANGYAIKRLPHRPRAATIARIGMIEEVVAEYEGTPISLRQLFYRCIEDRRGAAKLPKTENAYKALSDLCSQMRYSGRLSFDAIVDESRSARATPTFEDAQELARYAAGWYRADPWADAEVGVHVWAEARNTAASIAGVCRDYRVTLWPCGGNPSDSFIREAAPHHDTHKPVRLLYVGDWDKEGLHIPAQVTTKLQWHLPQADLALERVAVTDEQRDRYESNGWDAEIGRKVQAAAIPPSELQQMLRDALDELLPEHALRDMRIKERAEKAKLRAWAPE